MTIDLAWHRSGKTVSIILEGVFVVGTFIIVNSVITPKMERRLCLSVFDFDVAV